MTMASPALLISTSEICGTYRRSARTINRWRQSKENPFPAPAMPGAGTENLYRRDAVTAWFEKTYPAIAAA